MEQRRDRARVEKAGWLSQIHSAPRVEKPAKIAGRKELTMKDNHEIEKMIEARLDEIKTVPPRDPQLAARGRALFLNQAVSASEFPRRTGWKFIFRKEQFAMNMLVSILVIASLVFGGGATAVGAAQNDLPNEPLYALKTWSEDISLQFQNDPQLKVERLMELAEIRVQEMTQLAEDGQTPPDQVVLRLEQHIYQALQLCSNLDDAALDQTLLQIRDRLQEQDHLMQQLLIDASENTQPILLRTRDMLHTQLQLVEDGLLLGDMNQNMIQNQNQNGQSDEFTPPAQNETGTQFNQPTEIPGEPNPNPGGPNPEPGNSNSDPGGPNEDAPSDNSGGGNGNQP